MEYTSWIVHAMVDILTNKTKTCWHVPFNINKTAWKVTGSHPTSLNTPKKVMDNSTGFTRKLSSKCQTCTKKRCDTLKINKLKILNETNKTFKVLNKEFSDYVTTNSWKSPLQKIENHKIVIWSWILYSFDNEFLQVKPKYH